VSKQGSLIIEIVTYKKAITEPLLFMAFDIQFNSLEIAWCISYCTYAICLIDGNGSEAN
jgi:hypothetical protein